MGGGGARGEARPAAHVLFELRQKGDTVALHDLEAVLELLVALL
jgi:hypothetical protein